MDEIKLSNEGFIPSKRIIRLGKLKEKPILLEVGKPVSVKLNRASSPINLYIDEICLSNEYPFTTLNIRLLDYKYRPKRFINIEEPRYKSKQPKVYFDADGNVCIAGEIIGGIDE